MPQIERTTNLAVLLARAEPLEHHKKVRAQRGTCGTLLAAPQRAMHCALAIVRNVYMSQREHPHARRVALKARGVLEMCMVPAPRAAAGHGPQVSSVPDALARLYRRRPRPRLPRGGEHQRLHGGRQQRAVQDAAGHDRHAARARSGRLAQAAVVRHACGLDCQRFPHAGGDCVRVGECARGASRARSAHSQPTVLCAARGRLLQPTPLVWCDSQRGYDEHDAALIKPGLLELVHEEVATWGTSWYRIFPAQSGLSHLELLEQGDGFATDLVRATPLPRMRGLCPKDGLGRAAQA
eukprot:2843431-Prymnesium_polylepis.1